MGSDGDSFGAGLENLGVNAIGYFWCIHRRMSCIYKSISWIHFYASYVECIGAYNLGMESTRTEPNRHKPHCLRSCRINLNGQSFVHFIIIYPVTGR